MFFFFFKQKTAYEMRISDWSSDVCSSDLAVAQRRQHAVRPLEDRVERLLVRDARHDEVPAGGALARRPREPAALRDDVVRLRRGPVPHGEELGRASCRESVWQYV